MLAHPAKLWLINTDLDAADGDRTKMSPRNHNVAFTESQHDVIDPTNLRRALDDGVEHRLHVRGRAADDAEHLGRCGLMLQRLAQFRVTLLEFFEQPDVLDGDDRLVGEGLEKCDLLVSERSDFVRRIRLRRSQRPRVATERPEPYGPPYVRASTASRKLRLQRALRSLM